MDRLVCGVDRLHDREPRREQAILLGPVEGQPELRQLDDRVEVPAEAQVVADGAETRHFDARVPAHQEGGDIADRHRFGVAVAHRDLRDHKARGGVQTDGGHRLGHLDHPGLDQDRRGADGAVPAHRQQAGDLDVEHAPVRIGPGGRLQDHAAHGAVAARLPHQQLPQAVAVLHEPQAAFGHGRPGDRGHPAGDHPGGHALRMGIDGVKDVRGAHRGLLGISGRRWGRGRAPGWSRSQHCGCRAERGRKSGPDPASAAGRSP